MGIFDSASEISIWRGLEDFHGGKVLSCVQTDETQLPGR